MFDLVQKYKRVIQGFLGLIALTFATWGIESYTKFRGAADSLASVNGLEVTRREFDDEMRRQQDRMRQTFGGSFNAEMFDTPEARRMVLDGLVDQRVISAVAIKAGLTASDETLREVIGSIPVFQENGQFSKSVYENYLRSQNPPKPPDRWEADLRHDLALQQLSQAVAGSVIPSRTVVDRLAAIESQRREVSEARIAPQTFLPQVKMDDARLKEYYEANPAEFRRPERVRAEYVMLSAEQLARSETVAADEVRKEWEERYGAKFRARDAARKKAEAVLAQARANPGGFAELAKKESSDTASAVAGGDLGFQPRGALVKAFEDALFRLKPGEISPVVATEFGFHIIRLTEARKQDGREERRSSHILIGADEAARPFEEMRAQIEAELKKARAARRFNEAADNFTNMVYEQADSLKPVAERFKLPVQTTGWIVKSSAQELGALDNPKLIAALFSPDALQNKRNTDAIEVAPATLVAARVLEHQPAAQRSLDEVKQELAQMLRQREASTLAQKDGMAKLERLRKGDSAGLTWGAPRTVSRRDPKGMARELVLQAVAADVSTLPAYVGAQSQDGGYVLLRISKVIEADAAEKAADSGQRVSSVFGAAQYQAYVSSLRSQAKIEIRSVSPDKK